MFTSATPSEGKTTVASNLACVLAQRGWSVRVHERSDELREMGAGIYLKLNALAVLKELELYEQIMDSGMVLQRGRITGRSGNANFAAIAYGTAEPIVASPPASDHFIPRRIVR